MSALPIPRGLYRLAAAVQRIVVWCFLGCTLVREASRYRLVPGEGMPEHRRPPQKPIRAVAAEEAIRSGFLVPQPDGLFGEASSWIARAA